MGGFFIARGHGAVNLHRRIALNVISLAGSGTKFIWVHGSHGVPFDVDLKHRHRNDDDSHRTGPCLIFMPGVMTDKNGEQGGQRQFATCLLLGVCYAATIGGMATLIGTPPNAILVAQTSGIFPGAPGIDFFSWMTFAVPFMAIFLLISWFWLTLFTNRNMPEVIPGSRGHDRA